MVGGLVGGWWMLVGGGLFKYVLYMSLSHGYSPENSPDCLTAVVSERVAAVRVWRRQASNSIRKVLTEEQGKSQEVSTASPEREREKERRRRRYARLPQ